MNFYYILFFLSLNFFGLNLLNISSCDALFNITNDLGIAQFDLTSSFDCNDKKSGIFPIANSTYHFKSIFNGAGKEKC